MSHSKSTGINNRICSHFGLRRIDWTEAIFRDYIHTS